MGKPVAIASVAAYIAAHPPLVRRVLARVRSTIRKAVPGAEEVISYQIPTYKLGGYAVIYFAGWRQHYSIYPASKHVIATLGAALAPYKVHKGTLKFSLTAPVPRQLIARIARLRAQEVALQAATARPSRARRRMS